MRFRKGENQQFSHSCIVGRFGDELWRENANRCWMLLLPDSRGLTYSLGRVVCSCVRQTNWVTSIHCTWGRVSSSTVNEPNKHRDPF